MPTSRARSGNYVVYRTWANKLAEAALLPRRRRKVDAADADEDNEEGEVLEADAESQKRRKIEDAVAAMNGAEDVRMESDSGAFLVGSCNGEDPEDGNEDRGGTLAGSARTVGENISPYSLHKSLI